MCVCFFWYHFFFLLFIFNTHVYLSPQTHHHFRQQELFKWWPIRTLSFFCFYIFMHSLWKAKTNRCSRRSQGHATYYVFDTNHITRHSRWWVLTYNKHDKALPILLFQHMLYMYMQSMFGLFLGHDVDFNTNLINAVSETLQTCQVIRSQR